MLEMNLTRLNGHSDVPTLIFLCQLIVNYRFIYRGIEVQLSNNKYNKVKHTLVT